ncbi:MAG: transglutaminase domain-containing protein [Candidatus Bathyarchaeota archaeon]|nr:MAG: transglutaminase domain-containing protein [Candidatus Bathyarchaeota archaeon]
MEKMITVSFILFVLLASFTFYNFTLLESETWNASYIIRSTVTYSNQGTNIWNLTEEDRTISLFMNNTWQTVHLANHSCPLQNDTVDEDGNPMAVLQFQPQLDPGENVSYSVTYQVLSRPRSLPLITEENSRVLANITQDLRQKYCKGDYTWQIGNQMITDQAQAITGNETNVLKIVKEFIGWIWRNITYESHEVPMYPNQTLLSGKGDCDDQAILLVTFCRILGIPSCLQIGCIHLPRQYSNNTSWNGHVTNVARQIGWHGWAIVYVPPWGWLPVDLTYPKGGFGNPLNAIKTAVVLDTRTIQYMNISESDYAASAWAYRELITENGFYIYAEDEMTQTSRQSLWEIIIEKWFQRILVILVVTTCVIIVVYTYVSRVEKMRSKETGNAPEDFHR